METVLVRSRPAKQLLSKTRIASKKAGEFLLAGERGAEHID
jgi:hypothetical protein